MYYCSVAADTKRGNNGAMHGPSPDLIYQMKLVSVEQKATRRASQETLLSAGGRGTHLAWPRLHLINSTLSRAIFTSTTL